MGQCSTKEAADAADPRSAWATRQRSRSHRKSRLDMSTEAASVRSELEVEGAKVRQRSKALLSFSGSSPAFAIGTPAAQDAATPVGGAARRSTCEQHPGSRGSAVFSAPNSANSKQSVTFTDSPDTIRLSPEQDSNGLHNSYRAEAGQSNDGACGDQHAVYIADLDGFTAELQARLQTRQMSAGTGVSPRTLSSMVTELLQQQQQPTQHDHAGGLDSSGRPPAPNDRNRLPPHKQHAIHALASDEAPLAPPSSKGDDAQQSSTRRPRTVSSDRLKRTRWAPVPEPPDDNNDEKSQSSSGGGRRPMSREQRRKAEAKLRQQRLQEQATAARSRSQSRPDSLNRRPRGLSNEWNFAQDVEDQVDREMTPHLLDSAGSPHAIQPRSMGPRPQSRPASVPSEPEQVDGTGSNDTNATTRRPRLRSRPAPIYIPDSKLHGGATGILSQVANVVAPDTVRRRRVSRPGSARAR